MWIALLGHIFPTSGAVEFQCAATTIVQDLSRTFIQGETKDLLRCSPEEAEVVAFYPGLKVVDEFPFVPILIEGDSSMIV